MGSGTRSTQTKLKKKNTLLVMGVGGHPPPSPARASFTLMMECMPESRRCYSVDSVGGTSTYILHLSVLNCMQSIVVQRKEIVQT